MGFMLLGEPSQQRGLPNARLTCHQHDPAGRRRCRQQAVELAQRCGALQQVHDHTVTLPRAAPALQH
jgi:hypothetical protein